MVASRAAWLHGALYPHVSPKAKQSPKSGQISDKGSTPYLIQDLTMATTLDSTQNVYGL